MTSKLLKEAIADAKAVRETALANAKIALEEAFTPKLQSMLSKKLKEEIEGEEDEDEIQNENAVSSEIGKGDNKQPAKKAFDSAAETDELGAADVTKTSKAIGLEDPNRKKVADITEGEDEDKPEDVTGATPGSGLNEEEGDEDYTDGEVTEEEEATEDDLDLDEIIRELEGEVETEEEPVAEEDEIEITDEEPTAEAEEAPVADDEVDCLALIKALNGRLGRERGNK